jgi:transposase
MTTQNTTLEQRKFIEKQAKAGRTSPKIAEELGISVWTVRKWRQRLKKTNLRFLKWVVPKKAF